MAEDDEALRTMAVLMSWVATGSHGADFRVHLERYGLTEASWQELYVGLSRRFPSEPRLAEKYAALYQDACRERHAEVAGPASDAEMARNWGEVMEIGAKLGARHEASAAEPSDGYRPNLDLVAAALAQDPDCRKRLLEDLDTVFVVDHREDLLDIIGLVAARLPEGALGIAGLSEAGVVLASGDRSTSLQLTDTPRDRYAMLCACNRVLGPEYEIRFCVDSDGSDTLVFAVLREADWRACQAAAGSQAGHMIVPLPERDLFEG